MRNQDEEMGFSGLTYELGLLIVESETNVGRTVYSFSLLDVGENAAKLEGIAIFLEAIRALQVEPEELSGGKGTCSTLHFI